MTGQAPTFSDRDNASGALFMTLSMAGFAFNDALMKWVMADIGLFQAIMLRGFFAVPLMLFWFLIRDGWKTRATIPAQLSSGVVWLRVIGEVGGTYFFLTALSQMLLANVTAVLQILPLTITLAAAFIFGEKVGWRRYVAIMVGFVGVLMIIQPGGGEFSTASIYALICTAFLTLRDMATRRLPTGVSSSLVSVMTALAITIMGSVGAAFGPWVEVSTNIWAGLAVAAVLVLMGYQFSVLAMRHGDVGFVAPFRYSILIWALILGYLAFDNVPNTLAMIGAVIVVGSGLFTFYRERLSAKKEATSSASSAA